MKWIADVLDKFTPKERITVLVLLLVFTSFIYMGTNYFNSDKYNELNSKYEELSLKHIELLNRDNCASLREQNIQLMNDFVIVSNIIQTYKDLMNRNKVLSIIPPAYVDSIFPPSDSILYEEVNSDIMLVELINILEEMANRNGKF